VNFLKAGFNAIDDVKGIRAFAHDNDARNGFASAIEVGGSATDVGT
jgi:hypothetical protein